MAKVIKHFEGTGASTPYTCPAGKIAQIQGIIQMGSNSGSSTSQNMYFQFGSTRYSGSFRYAGTVTLTMGPDSSWFMPGISSTNGEAILSFGIGTASTYGYLRFSGFSDYRGDGTLNAAYDRPTMFPGPRIYLSVGDSLSFTNSGSFGTGVLGYNFIAIEEDA
jgi:hypothetical protein